MALKLGRWLRRHDRSMAPLASYFLPAFLSRWVWPAWRRRLWARDGGWCFCEEGAWHVNLPLHHHTIPGKYPEEVAGWVNRLPPDALYDIDPDYGGLPLITHWM